LSGNHWLMSALPPKAAVERTSVDVSNVPRTVIPYFDDAREGPRGARDALLICG
jgi:hypothetical protein